MGALYKGIIVTAVTSLLVMYPVTDSIIGLKSTYNNNAGSIFSGLDLYICGVAEEERALFNIIIGYWLAVHCSDNAHAGVGRCLHKQGRE